MGLQVLVVCFKITASSLKAVGASSLRAIVSNVFQADGLLGYGVPGNVPGVQSSQDLKNNPEGWKVNIMNNY